MVGVHLFKYLRGKRFLQLESLGVSFNSWVGVLLAAALLPPLVARIHAEERLLASQFGHEYAAYRGWTWRLIPCVC